MKKNGLKRKLTAALCAGLTASMFAFLGGCGSDYDYDYGRKSLESSYANSAGAYAEEEAMDGYYDEAAYGDLEAPEMAEAGSTGEAPTVEEGAGVSSRKLIRTINIDAETEEFDALIADVKARTNAAGGYIESSSMSTDDYSYYEENELPALRTMNMTIRIPADHLDEFLNSVSSRLNILSRTENVDDVTLNYVDMESHKKALKEEQDRILKLMEEAGTLDELIILEQRLTEVTYQLESIESQLRTYDNLVDYSTVYLSVDEVRVLTPVTEETASQKISRGFSERMQAIGNGFKNFGIWFVIHIVDILIIVGVIIVILIVIRAAIKAGEKKFKQNEEKRAQKEAEEAAKRAANPMPPVRPASPVPGQASMQAQATGQPQPQPQPQPRPGNAFQQRMRRNAQQPQQQAPGQQVPTPQPMPQPGQQASAQQPMPPQSALQTFAQKPAQTQPQDTNAAGKTADPGNAGGKDVK